MLIYAGVAELEYALVLGTNLARVVGSSPTAGTIKILDSNKKSLNFNSDFLFINLKV